MDKKIIYIFVFTVFIVVSEVSDSSMFKMFWFDKANGKKYQLNDIVILMNDNWYPLNHDGSLLYPLYNYFNPEEEPSNNISFLKYNCQKNILCKIEFDVVNLKIGSKLHKKNKDVKPMRYMELELFFLKSWKSSNGDIFLMHYNDDYNVVINTTSNDFLSEFKIKKTN